jgi:hypothetical protein
MKSQYRILMMILATALTVFSSCKKDDDVTVAPKQVDGTFTAFEFESSQGVLPLPAQGKSVEIEVTSVDKKNANVTLTLIDNDDTQTVGPIACTIEKDSDGFTVLNDKETKDLCLFYYDKNTVSYGLPEGQGTIAASRNGKKPNWWDD